MRPANTPARVASLRSLPPNKVVQQTRGGGGGCVYAGPLVCVCVYAGDQAAANGRCRQEALQRRLAGGQSMTAQMDETSWNYGPWGGLLY